MANIAFDNINLVNRNDITAEAAFRIVSLNGFIH